MKLENQVCSLSLAKRLKELGVKQESYFWWWHKWEGSSSEDAGKNILGAWSDQPSNTIPLTSAFTVAELGWMLPNQMSLTIKSKDGAWLYPAENGERMREFTEADARAKMLIYLLENKLI